MACACGGGGAQTTRNEDAEYEVRHPNGTKEIVRGLTAAKISATMSGGTYSAR
jgi:transcriptional/translational regulatory protein YebC/TACO1